MAAIVRMPAVALHRNRGFDPAECPRGLDVQSRNRRLDSAAHRLGNRDCQGFLLAPLLIAVHRYVLLGEVRRYYSFRPIGRYLRFVGYAVIFEIMFEFVVPNQWITKGEGVGWFLAIEVTAAIALVVEAMKVVQPKLG
jgi:hypothetical protein